MPPPHLTTQDNEYQRGVDAGLTVKIRAIFEAVIRLPLGN
jgi:hypothetical protein